MKRFLCLMLLLASSVPALAWSREIPIQDFFRDPEFSRVQLSPDGQHVAVIVPKSDRTVLMVLSVSDKKVVGKWDYGENRHFANVQWANDKRLLFWVAEKLGSFDYKVPRGDLFAANIDGTNPIAIPHGAYYQVVDLTREDPDTILVSRSIERANLSKLNVNNGRLIPVATSPLDNGSFLVDHDGQVRFTFGEMADGREVTYMRDGGDNSPWSKVHEAARSGDAYKAIGFSADNSSVYVARGDEGKPERLVLLNLQTRQETMLAEDGTVDASSYLWSSDERTLLAVRYDNGKPFWDFVAPEHPEAKLYAGLVKAFPGKGISFGGMSQDGTRIAFRVYGDTDPGQAYLYDTKTGKATYLLSYMDWIKPEEMSPMTPVTVTARDGLKIHGYLTVPKGSDGKGLPLIINPHGGPFGVRDDWGFNPEVQLLANRGFAVLQMNYRGSGGYGNAFVRAGYRKWGTAMQDDLTDSVKWAVSQGIADRNKVCIYGASYGGYAALMSVVREPDLYRCTVGYAGVYDLDIQHDADFADFAFGRSYLADVYPTTKSERMAQSPGYGVERIKAPVMLVHGGKDVRVPIRNMDFLVDQMAKAGKKPELVVVEPKEAHGFRDLNNNVNLYTKMLTFFDKYIGPKATTAGAAP